MVCLYDDEGRESVLAYAGDYSWKWERRVNHAYIFITEKGARAAGASAPPSDDQQVLVGVHCDRAKLPGWAIP